MRLIALALREDECVRTDSKSQFPCHPQTLTLSEGEVTTANYSASRPQGLD